MIAQSPCYRTLKKILERLMYKAALTKMSGSGHPTGSPLKVKKVWIWQLGGRQFCYLVRYFESSPVHAKFFF